jgi:hypothetical protein
MVPVSVILRDILLGMSGTSSLIIDMSLYTHRLNVCVEPFEEHTGTVQFLYWNSLLEMLELFVRNVVQAWNHLRKAWAPFVFYHGTLW